ncbi:MAG: DMT family transporter [Helicobacter sp.]|nr:DMT family transporter [Helicobacter sp.]
MLKLDEKSKFIALALLAELFITYASVLVKVVDIPPIMLAFYRVTLAMPIFFILAYKKEDFKRVGLKDFAIMFGAGLLFALDLIFFNTSLHHTSVGHANVIGSLLCFVLAPLGAIFFGEKIKKPFIFGSILSIAGVVLLMQGRIQDSVATGFGNFLALMAMIFYSFFLALVFHLRKRYSALTVMSFSSIGASVGLLIIGSSLEGFTYPQNGITWFYTWLIVLFGQILGQGFFSFIMSKLSTQTTSLLLLITPVMAAIMGFLFLGEKMGYLEILAIIIILVGIYFGQQKSHVAKARKKILKRGRKKIPAHLPLEHPQDVIRPL